MSNSATIDQKGRLKIPVTLLHKLNGSSTEFYITSEDGSSVRIYPMQVWNRVEERLERLCSHNGNNQKLLVRAKYFGQAVTMDKQGRVLIPIVLRSSAQMKGAVDIFDYLNYLEVWNHAQFLKDLKSSPITAQDEKTLNKLSSAPRFPWAIHRNKQQGHVRGTERRFRVYRQVSPDSRGHPSRISKT
jgi:MraZ protein